MRIKQDGYYLSKWKVALAEMPLLQHWVGKKEGLPFDPLKSEALGWLARQLDGQLLLWTKGTSTGLVTYDAETNTWAGVETRRRLAEGGCAGPLVSRVEKGTGLLEPGSIEPEIIVPGPNPTEGPS